MKHKMISTEEKQQMKSSAVLTKELQFKFDTLLQHAMNLTFKDERVAYELETETSYKQSRIYINAVIQNDTKLIELYHNNTSKNDPTILYQEHNTYFKELYMTLGIYPYTSRLADDFEIIHSLNMENFDSYEQSNFKQVYIDCLTYFKQVLYTDAFNDTLIDYRNFIKFFCVFMAIERYLDKTLSPSDVNYQLNTDYGIDQLLSFYNIEFLNNLPAAYKKRVIYNIGYIIRNKGSNNAFFSIFDIFGLKDIEILKYYLSKKTNLDTGESDLLFYKIPFNVRDVNGFLQSLPKSELKNREEFYDSVTKPDPTWKISKEEAEKFNFNMIATKYIDVESIRGLQRTSTDMAYIISQIKQIKKYRDGNRNTLNFNSSVFMYNDVNLFDAIIALNMTMIWYMGYEDIIATGEDIPIIYKFNPEVDKNNLSRTFNKYYDSKVFISLDTVDEVINSSIFNNVFTKNIELYNSMLNTLATVTDVNEYWDLEKDMKYLFMGDSIDGLFGDYHTYKDYILAEAPELKQYVSFIESNRDDTDVLRDNIQNIIVAIENFLANPDINLAGIGYTIGYIQQMINFFKSYTVDLREIRINYYADSPLNTIRLLDKMDELLKTHWHHDDLELTDKAKVLIELIMEDLLDLKDNAEFLGNIIVSSKLPIDDLIGMISAIISGASAQDLQDRIEAFKLRSHDDFIGFTQFISKLVNMFYTEELSLSDVLFIITEVKNSDLIALKEYVQQNSIGQAIELITRYDDFSIDTYLMYKNIKNVDELTFDDLLSDFKSEIAMNSELLLTMYCNFKGHSIFKEMILADPDVIIKAKRIMLNADISLTDAMLEISKQLAKADLIKLSDVSRFEKIKEVFDGISNIDDIVSVVTEYVMLDKVNLDDIPHIQTNRDQSNTTVKIDDEDVRYKLKNIDDFQFIKDKIEIIRV